MDILAQSKQYESKQKTCSKLSWVVAKRQKTKTKTLVARRAKGLRMNQRIKDRIRKDEH